METSVLVHDITLTCKRTELYNLYQIFSEVIHFVASLDVIVPIDISGENVRTHGASVPWMRFSNWCFFDVSFERKSLAIFSVCYEKETVKKNPCADCFSDSDSDFWFLLVSSKRSSEALNVWMVMIVATSTS